MRHAKSNRREVINSGSGKRPGNASLLTRRTFLRGMGTAMALPLLEAMTPVRILGVEPATNPLRMAFIYVPNGVNMADWTPAREGTDFELPYILEPLKPHQRDLQVLSGLAHRKADPNGDGPGDHARASASFLTGVQARKTAAVDIRAGVSADQVAAGRLGKLTRFPSLELTCDKGQQAGACDSGYSCAYQFNLAWKTPTTPLPPEVNPRLVFERLFGSGDAVESAKSRAARQANHKSILDFVLEDARQLRSKLGATDRGKLDEYMTSVREIEQRIEYAEKLSASAPDYTKPASIPADYEQHIRVMFDLLALAFQTDTTRIATFMIAHDGSNRSYPSIGVSDGHHDLSHHGGNSEKKKKIAAINHFHVQQFARFLEKLKGIREGSGSLLDNSMVVYGSGIADGNAHAHYDLPVLLAGRGGGTLKTGRHVRYATDTPMTNLYLAMLDRMGAHEERFGDSTGQLANLG
ncbi:MAG: DUF1552 domain-containing protein [Verrucomicrobia subdivision 3 bacterium]|nr:DUF1552 domain-containing protein [Limisphaerales bacterium]